MAEATENEASNPPPPARFDLVTLGAAALVRPDGRLALDRSKQLALLTYLHAAPRRTARREQLCALLWGNSAPEAAGRAFRSTLSRMRSLIGEPVTEGSGADVSLHAAIVSDRDQFLVAVNSAELELAVELYTGPFFPSYSDSGSAQFEEWVDVERARLQESFVRSAESLVHQHLDQGHYRRALEVSRRVRAHAPDAETGWRLLLESLVAGHDDLAARAEAEGMLRWLSQNEREADLASARLLKLIREGAAGAESNQPGGLISELVGREQEFSAILQAWELASKGAPRHLHIRGDAGLGKTRLLSEVSNRIKALGGAVISVRATPGERDVDYALAAELARALGNGPGAAATNPASTPILVHLQPALASQFPLAKPLGFERDLTMQRAQALGELLSAIADDTPVALMMDDLHWADRESRRVLSSISERLGRNRALVLTAGRPAEGDLPGQAAVLPLPRLTVADTEALLASVGEPPSQEWSERLARALHQSSRGSPLLILETLLLARERGELCLEAGHWSSPDLDRLVARVESARALETRLLRLDHAARRHLLALATAGTPLHTDEFRQILGDTAGGKANVLEELERSGYLTRRDQAWDISHDEVAAASLELAPVEERRAAHAMLGSWLAGTTRDDRAALSRAARHLLLGGQELAIAPVFTRWVKHARAQGDHSPVMAHAKDLLGQAVTDSLSNRLVRSLPIRLRYRLIGPAAAGLAAASVLLVATLALTRLDSEPVPEAELMLIDQAPIGGQSWIYRLPVTRERWTLSDSLSVAEGHQVGPWRGRQGSFAVSPGGQKIAYSQTVQDSGVTDLYLQEARGESVRITAAAGDDVSPSWSPDGSHLAFQSARFTPRGDEDSDIAVIDVSNGRVRQVTSGPDYDAEPEWSPDGTRIAFHRTDSRDGTARICWSTVDAARSVCLDALPGKPGAVIGWRGPDRLLVVIRYENGETNLIEVTLSTNQIRMVDAPGISRGFVSSDGKWLAVNRTLPDSRTSVSEVFPFDEPWRRRAFVSESLPDRFAMAWIPHHGPEVGRWSLRIVSPDSGLVGVGHQMAAQAFDSNGARLTVAQAAVHWRSSDSGIVRVDPITGMLDLRARGETWVIASAGGLRVDSILFRASESPHRMVFTEPWTDPTMPAWELFGTPQPVVSLVKRGKPAFLNNGDYAYDSGALTKAEFIGHFGLGFETTLSLPVNRPKWQTIRLFLGSVRAVLRDGVDAEGCSFAFPAGEGVEQMRLINVSAYPDVASLAAPRDLTDGRDHRLRMQVFPDHTCGVALDGRPIWRSTRPIEAKFPFRLSMFGRTVGAQLLVGPIEIWEGVKPGVEWKPSKSVSK